MLLIYGIKEKVLNSGTLKDEKQGDIQYTIFQNYYAIYSIFPLWPWGKKKYELTKGNATPIQLDELSTTSKATFANIYENSKLPNKYRWGFFYFFGGFALLLTLIIGAGSFYSKGKKASIDKVVYRQEEVAANLGNGIIFSTESMSPDAKWKAEYFKVQKIEGDSVYCEKMNTQKTVESYDDISELPNDLAASGETKIYSKKGLVNNATTFEFVVKDNKVVKEPGNRVHSFFKVGADK